MKDEIKLCMFLAVIAGVAVIFVKPLNERFTGLFSGETSKKEKITVAGKSGSKTLNEPKNQTAVKHESAPLPAKKKNTISSQKVSYDIKRIQSLLRKAGFYKGEIDGKMGPETIRAIKQFQRSKNLKDSGVINVKTWEELKKNETGR